MRTTTTKVKKSMELIKEDEEWCAVEFPGLSTWWVHQKLMEAFRAAYENNPIKMQDMIDMGAKEVQKLFMIDSETD